MLLTVSMPSVFSVLLLTHFLSSLEIATTAERNQIMGHSRAEIYDKYYINEVVGTDTQSAYLGTPSKDALINPLVI